jgi:MFS transporter, AAHS family, 4-hydroxybenzoate transporter
MTSAAGPLPVPEIIDRRPVGRLQVQLAVLCSLVLLFDGADTIVIGLVGQGMAHTVGVPVAVLGSVFSAGQFGFFFGALVFGPLGDRVGRKPVLVGSVALFGVATILTTLAHTVGALVAFRFLTGLGLGGAGPVAVSLVAEYMPARIRATLVALSWAAFPLGGAVISLASTVLLAHGWQVLFALLGGLAAALSLLLIFAVPESLTFLAAKRSGDRRLRTILNRLGVAAGLVPATESKPQRVPVRTLFTGGRALQTVLLWAAFFSSFLPLIFVTNWAPTILHQHGIGTAEIGMAIALNSVGSALGSGSVGRAMDRLGSHYVVVAVLAAAAVSLLALGVTVGGFTGVAIAITAAGIFAGAGQTGIITLGSLLYPTLIRSTALGWAMAMGRLGAATGPLLGGAMIAAGWGPVGTFGAVAAFPVAALACVVLVRAFTDTRLPRQATDTAGLASRED